MAVDWKLWVEKPGLPPKGVPSFATKNQTEAEGLADEYIKLGGKASPKEFDNYNQYVANVKVLFLLRLIEKRT